MPELTRRQWLAGSLALTALDASAQTPLKLKPRTSSEIKSSSISIGFETLDRSMFDPDRTYEWIGQTGVKWARCQTGWGRTERTKGEYDFAWLDKVVDRLLSLGIQPWFNLGYGNQLYTPEAPHYSAVGWAPIFNPDALAGWQRYVGKLADRFRDRVKYWELWNEPNIPNYWQPRQSNAADYTKLVASTAPIIRKQIPGVTLIGGVIAGLGENYGFVEGCMEAGLGSHIDRFSYHPYRARPELNYAEDLAALRAILHRYRPGLPVWQGENGAPSEPKGFGALAELAWTEETQAKWLLRRLVTDLALGVEVSSYFLIVDLANYVAAKGVDGRTNFKGVLRATDYKPKKSFYALQNLCSLFDSDMKPAALNLRFSKTTGGLEEAALHQHSFQRKGVPVFAYWYPSDLPKDFTPGQTQIYAWTGVGAKLNQPILIDLRDGTVTRWTNVEQRTGALVLRDVPVTDSPTLISDAALLG